MKEDPNNPHTRLFVTFMGEVTDAPLHKSMPPQPLIKLTFMMVDLDQGSAECSTPAITFMVESLEHAAKQMLAIAAAAKAGVGPEEASTEFEALGVEVMNPVGVKGH